MAGAYYNEFDPGAAAWLRELIRRGLIADGEVDERSILDVRPVDLAGFTQCHFFAGIGGWSYALRLAGWPDDRPVWTGSPPCQPFSAAGRRIGRDDARHLAPHFVGLVRACRPDLLFGEQVASADIFGGAAKRAGKGADGQPQWAWIDDLSDRLEAARYAVGAVDLPAAGVGAPHIRQRTFFGAIRLAGADGRMGDASDFHGWWGAAHRRLGGSQRAVNCQTRQGQGEASGIASGAVRLADADNAGSQGRGGMPERANECAAWAGSLESGLEHAARDGRGEWRAGTDGRGVAAGCGAGGLADADRHGRDTRPLDRRRDAERDAEPRRAAAGTDAPDGPWRTADWLFCRDGKWRPVEPGTFPLAHGLPARVGRLRGYGNAIVPQAAAEFIRAFVSAAAI